MNIPFNKPHLTSRETKYIRQAHLLGKLAGDGYYSKNCQTWIENKFNVQKSLLTHSCTAALEMMSILVDIKPGDEIIMPSFTFSSTANAVVLRGGVPVFIDIREDTKNIDESLIEEAINKKTKAIFVVHYAGVACEMDIILRIAKKHKLIVLEDAAQGFLSKYKEKYLGTIGDLGAYSFHETKNIISGEGGSLLINNPSYTKRAEIIREKGTNRSQFFRGEVDKYTWVDIGSSYLPGEVIAAFLMAQLEQTEKITNKRIRVWNKYHTSLKDLEDKGFITRPFVPDNSEHNAHLYSILVKNPAIREKVISYLKRKGIMAIFHYIPLHSSPAGKKYGRFMGTMRNTDRVSSTLIRLPLFYDITNSEVEYVVKSLYNYFKR
jgi:dTDP-4-amino-4,6-dideoxygalactose transaminase